VVRQIVAWMGGARLTIGDIGRRLTHAGKVTRTGKTVGDRSVVWGLLKHPASRGAAACGKTHPGPLQPRRRAQRGRPLRPRRAVSTHAVPPEDWRTIALPARVEVEVFRAVQAQVQAIGTTRALCGKAWSSASTVARRCTGNP
jgi:site-specific DNA recombinase